MKAFMKFIGQCIGLLVLVALGFLVYKIGQKACWENKASFINPPSLDSWDPTERFEAAREASKKFGGTK